MKKKTDRTSFDPTYFIEVEGDSSFIRNGGMNFGTAYERYKKMLKKYPDRTVSFGYEQKTELTNQFTFSTDDLQRELQKRRIHHEHSF